MSSKHQERHGTAWIPLQSTLEDDYKSLEAELLVMPGPKKETEKPAYSPKKAKVKDEEFPDYPTNVDAKTLARLKVRTFKSPS
jgi:hypothetical protein